MDQIYISQPIAIKTVMMILSCSNLNLTIMVQIYRKVNCLVYITKSSEHFSVSTTKKAFQNSTIMICVVTINRLSNILIFS